MPSDAGAMTSTSARHRAEVTYLGLIVVMVAASIPSLIFCALEIALAIHGHSSWNQTRYNMPAQTVWDQLLGFDALAYGFIARWNRLVTVMATIFLICSLLRPSWRALIRFALLPYLVILAADVILRWHYHLLP